MDGLPPPPQTIQPSGPPGGGLPTFGQQQQAQQNAPRSVGRPAADPERNEERAERSAALNKFTAALPKSATDYRVSIYRLKGRRGTHRESRPIMRILLTDLEEAQNGGTEPEEFIADKLLDKFGDERPMRFLCVPQDAHGKALPKLASWETSINSDDEDDEDEDYMDDIEHGFQPGTTPFGPQGGYQPPWQEHNQPPPAPPEPQHNTFNDAITLLQHRRQEESSNTAMMLGMFQAMQQQQQQSAQMMMAMLSQQGQTREQAAEERRREEARREEERRREEEKRTEGRLQLIATMAPVLTPLIQRVLEGKEDKITPMLLTKFLEGDRDRNSNQEMLAMMSEASKQQMLMQGEMARQNMTQQSEVQRSMISHVLEMAKDSVQAQRNLENNKEDGPMETFSNIMGAIGPLLQNIGADRAAPQAQAQPQPQQAPLPPQAQPQPQQAPQGQAPTGPPTRETHPHLTDHQWVAGALRTVGQMERGEVPAERRKDAIRWMAQTLPQPLLQAIADKDEEAISQHTAGVVMSDEKLLAWLSNEKSQVFLRDVIEDMSTMLRNGAQAPQQPPTNPQAEQEHEDRKPQRSGKIPPPPVTQPDPASEEAAPEPAPATGQAEDTESSAEEAPASPPAEEETAQAAAEQNDGDKIA